MNRFIQDILERPRQQKIGILAGAVVLLLLLGYFYVYAPTADQVARLNDELASAEADRDKKRAVAANLPKLRRELAEWDAKVKAAMAQLPDSKEIPELLSNLSTKAREAGLEIVLFRPRAETFQDFYAEIPIDIVVRGGFYNALTFFDEVGRMSRPVNIDNISLKKYRDVADSVTLEISTLATTYRFLDEAERKRIAEEKAKSKAKG
ncbi:MAG TPA: type 4a pilus biogenesis protein PilO [Candidatus Eisenbacteria bacterium]|nr:type 4a pilus biogenesis protein PilO [Candidatus Eisenbacteria bacterium]